MSLATVGKLDAKAIRIAAAEPSYQQAA